MLTVKIDPEEFLDADHRGHENRAWHSVLCENDGMRAKALPPDFLTRLGFLLLCRVSLCNVAQNPSGLAQGLAEEPYGQNSNDDTKRARPHRA